MSGGLCAGCATAAAQQGTSVPSCTCVDGHQMIGLQQLCSRCLHRNAPETVVVTLHRRELVHVEAAVTCKLTSVQTRQPWLCWQSLWVVPYFRADRCAAGCQVLVDVCMSMWAMLLQCFLQGTLAATKPVDRVFLTRAIAKLWQCPCFTGRLTAAAMRIHQHALSLKQMLFCPSKRCLQAAVTKHASRIAQVASLLAIFCSRCAS